MKFLSAILFLTAGILTLPAENLVRNPDFEGMKPWSPVKWTRNYGTVNAADNRMILVNHDLKQTTMAQQSIKLKSGTGYSLSFRIRGENIVTDGGKKSGACVMILHKGKFVYEGSPAGAWQAVSGTFDWKPCRLSFKTGEISEPCNLYLVLRKSTGSVSFADILLEEEETKRLETPAAVSLIPICWQKNVCNLAEGMPGLIFCTPVTGGESSPSSGFHDKESGTCHSR